jgi:hypothetical protein
MTSGGLMSGSFSGGSERSIGSGSDRTTAASDGKALTDQARSETIPASLTDRSTLSAIQSMDAARHSVSESPPVAAMLGGVSIVSTNERLDSNSGMAPWNEVVAKYIKDGSVEIKSAPGIAQLARQSAEIGVGNRGEVYQAEDPSKVIKEGDFYEIVAQSAAFARLRAETDFVVPDSTVLTDPLAPNKAFLEMDKLSFHKPGELYEFNSPYKQELLDKADVVLQAAQQVIGKDFVSDLKVDDNWGIVDNKATMAKLDKGRPLVQSDIAIYDPVSYFAMQTK